MISLRTKYKEISLKQYKHFPSSFKSPPLCFSYISYSLPSYIARAPHQPSHVVRTALLRSAHPFQISPQPRPFAPSYVPRRGRYWYLKRVSLIYHPCTTPLKPLACGISGFAGENTPVFCPPQS